MYQGKFNSKGKGQKASKEALYAILEERKNSPPPQPVRQPAARPNPAAKRPQGAPQQAVRQNPAAPQNVQRQQPVRQAQPAPQPAPQAKRRGPRLGGVIFYTLYFLFIFLFFVATFFVLQWLHGWLGDYEAAQPTVKCQEVFQQLFGNPDWAKLYHDAGVADTEYEGVDQYVAYMTEKVGDKKLDFVETSAGLSGDKKYIVRLENEKIATFTLEGQGESITDIPDWELGKVEVFFQRNESYLIQKVDGHKAYVNGVELGDDATIQIATTKVEKYLPIGTVGARVCTQKIDDLLSMPEVKITNQAGQEMEVIYDEANRTFAEQTVSSVISDEEREVTLGALKAYAEFMINASGSRAAVSKYFDGSSDTYSDIIKMAGELWMNKDYGHGFLEEEVTNYCRYSDDLFSVHGKVVMQVTCKDSSTKQYTVDQSLFFRKKDGKWICYEMTNEDVSQPVGKVRLTFMHDGNVLSSEFYETNSQTLQAPVISVPDGKVFSGWVRRDVDETGHTTLTVVFTPDESGLVTLSNGANLEPMTLYALLENASAGGETA